MITIPNQLQDMKFCRVRYKTKKPFELDWTNKPYTLEEIKQHISKGEQYGILTGHNNLGGLDDDSEDKFLMKLFEDKFGKSYRTRDHYYIYLKGWDCQTIKFYDSEGKSCGELQGMGAMVVGAGSIHPSGEEYDLREDLPIKTIDYKDFIGVFGDYVKKKKRVVKSHVKTEWEGENITDIPITNIISLGGLTDMGGGNYQGPHPKHGSVNGMNFRVNTLDNSWYCFRCRAGGGPSELIAVMENVLDCSAIGPSCYSKDQSLEVIRLAREKYGLKSPNKIKQPMGWALSINIRRFAERHNFTDCPQCDEPFEFNELLGFYKCNKCKYQGGLKRFAELLSKHLVVRLK